MRFTRFRALECHSLGWFGFRASGLLLRQPNFLVMDSNNKT